MPYAPPDPAEQTLRTPAEQHPRIVEEHHVVGPRGEDEIDATDELGHRWYRLRPDPRRRADLIGFNYIWWFALWMFLILIFVPWGSNWGW